MIDRQTSIALLREELEQQRTRAEAAEAELRGWQESYKSLHAEHALAAEALFQLRRVVDAWKAADKAWSGTTAAMAAFRKAEEALRHA
jgi:hypothetical protein